MPTWVFKRIFKKNINYKKAGVILTDLTPSNSKQLNLFQNTGNTHGDLMKTIDKIHLRFGEIFKVRQPRSRSNLEDATRIPFISVYY